MPRTIARRPPTVSTRPADSPTPASPVALIASLLGFAVITIDVSAVNIALPAIRSSLHGGMSGLQWVVDAYTLMFAALMMSAGALADRSGARRAYAWGIALFTLASLGCALAPGIGVLIAARLAQGAAAAVVMPASLALIRQAYDDPARRARAIALWTVGGSVSMAAGPVLGGILAEHAGWRAVFLLNLPVGAVILALLARTAPSPRRPAPLDPAGQTTAVLALAGLAYAVIEGGHHGWTSVPVLAASAVAAGAAVAFLAVEKRHRAPMVPLGMLRERRVAVSLAAGFAANAAFYGLVFLLGLYYQQARGMTATEAGLMFVPLSAVITTANLVSPRLAERVGRRAVIVLGQAVLALAMAALLPLSADTPLWLVLLLLVPTGLGGALAVPALTALLMDAVPGHRAGTASGLFNAVRQTGGALAVAVSGALIADGGAGDGFSLGGMRESLYAAGGLLCLTTALTAWLLRRERTA
ncbi:MFS transporter [Streptomyces mobaraensis NBRC 13819 = DSM 40847]|uniref:MFS transporter n=2 Tax=Streptomyces mobaraensis TaxID=35621 RepID=A0A5N5WDP2_STRMB|nr:MFS transporter [Streptomyces mobaraensis]EMF02556.1 major facilitator superfamily protein [Streptomyces mobaraensis NBRC 13819 = DSM 40847]KAB7851045.1 MFS transporter [Streptomyces mobaraensis]QTT75597.1 MFS transporter [Streptomyces mobaraensis NBRC 13819 = DSM 40847]